MYRPAESGLAVTPTPTVESLVGPPAAARLLGRDAELDVLRRMIADGAQSGGAIVVRGEAGVGKSSLLRTAADLARSTGRLVLQASGIESALMLPFAGLHQLLRPVLGQSKSIPLVQETALLTAFGLQQGPPPEVFLIALAALTLMVNTAATRPVVVIVDDTQWLDSPTNDVLAFVSRRINEDAVVVITGRRDGHPTGTGPTDMNELPLLGLDESASRAILDTVAADLSAAQRREIMTFARGNPLALVELPVALRSVGDGFRGFTGMALPLTTRLERAFAERVRELPARTRDALLVAAVNADDSLSEVLAATAFLSGLPATIDVLESAERAGLLTFDSVSVRFRHPLVRSGVLCREPPYRQQAAHAAMSSTLKDETYRSVWHEAHSVDGPDDDVADRLDKSHVESLRRGSVLAAVAGLERSAELTSDSHRRGQRFLLAAQHAYGLGRGDLVDRLVGAAEANALSELDRARAEWLRELFTDTGRGNSARVRALTEHAARSAAAGEEEVCLELLFTAGLRSWWIDTEPEARDGIIEVAASMGEAQQDPRSIAAVAMTRPVARGRQTIRQLTAIAPGSVSDADQLRQLGTAARAVGDEVSAADYFYAAQSRLREHGRLGLLPQVLAVDAAVCVDLGDWRRAASNLDESRRLTAETGQPTWGAGVAAVEAVFAALTGDSAQALELSAAVESACPERVQRDFLCLVQIARGIAHVSQNRHKDAYAALEPIFDPGDDRHHEREQLSGLMFLAEAAAHCDQRKRARRVISRMEEIAVITPSPVLRVHLLYSRAVLADGATAEQLFQDALDEDLIRWPWPRARIQLAYGTWLRQQRRIMESREPLRAALATFEFIGAASWSRLARAGLRAAGERDAAREADAAGSVITAQELQIARLAASGLSNAEIGQQLYLSPRTVSSHLYRIFPKLGVTSRAQLPGRLREL